MVSDTAQTPSATRVAAARPAPVRAAAVRKRPKHRSPTPVFAFADHLILSLPYPKNRITAIAYHQVYAPGSLRFVPAPQVSHVRMRSDVPQGMEQERRSKSTTRTVRQRKMFRSDRAGPADRAVDVGAKRGTVVRAPVSGRISQVRSYMLYGRYPDYEIDIVPDANPRVRVMMFHIDSVVARVGRRVLSGVTPLGKVRDLASCFEPQLAELTHERGNHVHIQIKPRDVP